jgi:hypothetical protein
MSDKTRDIKDVIREMFADQDSEVANLLCEMFEVVTGAVGGSEPELIQGYTAEQWQEIIDGGYLCEFHCELQGDSPPRYYGKLQEMSDSGLFRMENSRVWFEYCRPAQIKGVMRPIFVEPVDRHNTFVFFDAENAVVGHSNLLTSPSWHKIIEDCPKKITSYIEL